MADTASKKHTAPSIWFQRKTRTEAAKALVEWNDEGILSNWSRAARAYLYGSAFEGYTMTSLSSFGCDVRVGDMTLEGSNIPIYVNRIRSMAQTFVALTGANDDPEPQFVTNDGTFEQEQAAEDMDRVVCAEYESQHGAYADFHGLCRKLELMVTTALGRGWVFVAPGNYGGRWKPEAEIDDGLSLNVVREHQYGRILTLSRSTWRDPEALISRYGKKHKQAILDNVDIVQPSVKSGAGVRSLPALNTSVEPSRRLVRVVQGWHVSTGKDDPGRELFTLKDGHCLEDNAWTRPSPPCRHIDYDEELSADGGTPLTHTIYRMFCRENEMIHDTDQLERAMPLALLLSARGTGEAGSVKKQLESSRGIEVLEVADVSALREVPLGGIPRKTMELMELYARLQQEIPGISGGHSQAAQANHVSSGIQASMEASLFPERHADFVMRFNRFRAVDCAELFVWAIQDIVANGDMYSAWSGDEETKKLIKGDQLDLDLSKYRVQIKPASARKDSVATRLQKAEKWLEDPTVTFTGADMAQFWKTYDVDRFSEELDAITGGVRRQIRKWRSLPIHKAQAQYRSPAKWMTIPGLESALRTVVADYEDARDSNVPDDRLLLWENYMNQCTSLIRTLKLDEARIQAEALGKAAAGASNGGKVAGAAGAAPGPGAGPGSSPVPAPGGAIN